MVRQLVCLEGTIPVSYRGSTYNIPIRLIYQDGFPQIPPVIKVMPTETMRIAVSQVVAEDGTVAGLPYILGWNLQCNVLGLIEACRAEFSMRMPVFGKKQ